MLLSTYTNFLYSFPISWFSGAKTCSNKMSVVSGEISLGLHKMIEKVGMKTFSDNFLDAVEEKRLDFSPTDLFSCGKSECVERLDALYRQEKKEYFYSAHDIVDRHGKMKFDNGFFRRHLPSMYVPEFVCLLVACIHYRYISQSFVENFLKKEPRQKPRKTDGYLVYFRDRYIDLTTAQPNLGHLDVVASIEAEWKSLDDNDRTSHEERARQEMGNNSSQ